MQLNFPPQQKITKLNWLIFVVLLASAVLSSIAVGTSAQSDGLLKVYFLDVGQGDAEFIQAPNGNQVLIDGGPTNAIIGELGKVMPFYDHSIDLVILTHPHADHVDGLVEVLKRYKVSQILENNVPYSTADYAEWNKAKSAARVTQAQAGQTVDLGEGVKITILFPFEPGAQAMVETKNAHDYMVVSRLDYGSEGVLFAGDAEAKTEYKLISAGASLSAQFLKVGHHGSKTSTTDEFLKAVKPVAAFIEVGARNKYGHPHPTVLERLETYGVKYYRTDIDGTTELALDGQDYKIASGK